jgi:hypothetical protein
MRTPGLSMWESVFSRQILAQSQQTILDRRVRVCPSAYSTLVHTITASLSFAIRTSCQGQLLVSFLILPTHELDQGLKISRALSSCIYIIPPFTTLHSITASVYGSGHLQVGFLTPQSRVRLEKLIVAYLVKKFSIFYSIRVAHYQSHTRRLLGVCPEPDESNRHRLTVFLYDPF